MILGALETARWILLRGLSREAGHWGPFIDAWRARLPETDVCQPDLPGCGTDCAGRSPWSVPRILEAVRDAVGVDQPSSDSQRPMAVFGLSLGGMVALEWVRRYPKEVAGAVLVNASIAGPSPPWRRLRPSALWTMTRGAAAWSEEQRQTRLYGLVSNRPDRVASVVPSWVTIAALRPVRPLNVVRQLMAAVRYHPRLSAATPSLASALVLTGPRDRMVDPTCSRAIAAAIGAELREHPTAGHDLPLDDPDWVATEVANWATRMV